MKKGEYKYLVIFVAMLAFVVWANANMSDNAWELSLDGEDARAYGSEILFEALPFVVGEENLSTVNVPPYELIADTTLRNTNYMFITAELPADEVEWEALTQHVARGNVVFIAAHQFENQLLQRLGVRNEIDLKFNLPDSISYLPDSTESVQVISDSLQAQQVLERNLASELAGVDSIKVNFIHPDLVKQGGYFYSTDLLISHFLMAHGTAAVASPAFDVVDVHFTEADSVEVVEAKEEQKEFLENNRRYDRKKTVLGQYEEGGVNFVKIDVGEGFFLLSTIPLAFSNLNMLTEDNAEYAYTALSYQPAQKTFWDQYYKPNKPVQQTPLRYIFTSPGLKAAYYLALFGILLFMVSNIRRKQRVIPVIPPVKNTTVEFAHTMGHLYLGQGDHGNLAIKMIDQFRHYVQEKLRLPASDVAVLSVDKIAARSGVEIDEVSSLLALIQAITRDETINEEVLINLAGSLDAFYMSSKR